MPNGRRRQIADIADRRSVYLIEDDVYGFLLDEEPAPLFTYTPKHGIYLTSLSKAVASGLRTGFVVVPDGQMAKFISAMRTNVLMASPINVEIAADLINSGAGRELALGQRDEICVRQAMVADRLHGLNLRRHPASSHCWMPVPSCFPDEHAFRARLLEKGVNVMPGSVFAIDDGLPLERPHERLCLGAEPDRNRLDQALEIIYEIARCDETHAHPEV
ncbi:MAG: aminotransferase class I/II-fold pyridoxal phosphate-dependent enzyme [Rhodospirillaceae bacterium]